MTPRGKHTHTHIHNDWNMCVKRREWKTLQHNVMIECNSVWHVSDINTNTTCYFPCITHTALIHRTHTHQYELCDTWQFVLMMSVCVTRNETQWRTHCLCTHLSVFSRSKILINERLNPKMTLCDIKIKTKVIFFLVTQNSYMEGCAHGRGVVGLQMLALRGAKTCATVPSQVPKHTLKEPSCNLEHVLKCFL